MPRRFTGDNRINVRVEPDLKKQLRKVCEAVGSSETKIVSEAIWAAVRHWNKWGGLILPFEVMPNAKDVAKQAAYLDAIAHEQKQGSEPKTRDPTSDKRNRTCRNRVNEFSGNY